MNITTEGSYPPTTEGLTTAGHVGAISAAPSQAVWPPFLLGQPEQPVTVLLIDDAPHARQVMAQELWSMAAPRSRRTWRDACCDAWKGSRCARPRPVRPG